MLEKGGGGGGGAAVDICADAIRALGNVLVVLNDLLLDGNTVSA